MIGRVLLAVSACGLSACVITREPAGPTQYDSQAIERDSAKELNVRLRMGAGQLKVGSGTHKLMQGYYTYNVGAWKPEVRHTAGELTISQPETHSVHIGNHKYEWDLRFAQDIPIHFHLNFGAGEAQLDLGSLTLRNVDVEMGVGSVKLDLRGHPKQDYDVRINGGVGEAVVHVPSTVGVQADASGGIGEISVHGLSKRDGHWVNDAFSEPGPKIHLSVHGGIGSITLYSD